MDAGLNYEEIPSAVSAEQTKEIVALERLGMNLKSRVEEAVGARFPLEAEKQSQLFHMPRVAANVLQYIQKEFQAKNIPVSEKEKKLAAVFAWGHDAGKFLDSEIIGKINELDEVRINDMLNQMGLTEEEKWIFAQAVSAKRSDQERLKQGERPGYNREWDIAHNLLSAFYLEASDFLGEGSNLKPETKKLIIDMVIAHQFSGYYQDLARGLNWGDQYVDAINAIKRFKDAPISDYCKLMLKTAKSGDIIEMLAIGNIGLDGKFTPGGLVKILNLSLKEGVSIQIALSEAISRVGKSINQVMIDLQGAGCDSAIKDGKILFNQANSFLDLLSCEEVKSFDGIWILRQHILASAQNFASDKASK